MTPPIAGIVTGLQIEADIARSIEGVRAACFGPGPEKATAAALSLIEQGVTTLVSFGIAGGLDPALKAGDLVAEPAAVAAQLKASAHSLVTIQDPVLTPAAKKALFVKSGAAAVDMETAAVRAVAAAHQLRFMMIRAICDEAGDTIPAIALKGMQPDGTIRPARVAAGLLTRPQDLSALLHLGRQQKLALAALKRAAACIDIPK